MNSSTTKTIPFSMKWVQQVSVAKLASGEKVLALALFTYMNTKGACWPSAKTLATHTGHTREWVATNRAGLERAGYLSVNRKAALASKGSCLHQALIPSPVTVSSHVPVTVSSQRSEPLKRSEPEQKKSRLVREGLDLELTQPTNLHSLMH
jgi:hypothetical protein